VTEQDWVSPGRNANAIVQPKPPPPGYENISLDAEIEKFIAWCEESERRLQRLPPDQQLPANNKEDPPLNPALALHVNTLLRPMPKSNLPPVFPTGPLNLNTDGTEINYNKNLMRDLTHRTGQRLTVRRSRGSSQRGQSNR
jgi:hypothetical protein